jgi:hypothetical protein
MSENKNLPSLPTPFLLYTAADGKVKVEVFVQDETVWLTQKRMSELFSVDVRTISEHLRNIFDSNELQESATVRKIRTVQKCDFKGEIA